METACFQYCKKLIFTLSIYIRTMFKLKWYEAEFFLKFFNYNNEDKQKLIL